MVTALINMGCGNLSAESFRALGAGKLPLFIAVIAGVLMLNTGLGHEIWLALRTNAWVRILSLLVILPTFILAWVVLRAVLTDCVTLYMMGSTALVLRVIVSGLFCVVAFAFAVWGVETLLGY